MRTMKRTLCLALCLTLCLCLAGGALGESVEYPIGNGETTLDWWIPMNGNLVTVMGSYNEHPIYQQLMKDTGVNINFTHPATGQEKEEFGLMLVSGEMPDIIQTFAAYYTGGVQAGYDDGVVMDLTDLVKEYAPDYYKLISANEETWRQFTTDGKILAFYTYWEEYNPTAMTITLRQDWLDEFGLKAEDMTTYDAIEEYFQKIKETRPDVAPLYLSVDCNEYYLGYNVRPDWYQVDGQVCYYDAGEQTQYRAWLQRMADWYQKGYISPDFASYSASEARSMFSAGLIGCFCEPIGNVWSDADASGLPVVKSPYWKESEDMTVQVYFPEGLERNGGQCTVITTACKDPVTAVKLLNYGYTDAGMMLTNYGIEDMCYTVGEDGAITYTDLVLKNENYGTAVTHQLYRIHWIANRKLADTTCNPNVTKRPDIIEGRLLYTQPTETFNGDNLLPSGVSLTVEENSERSSIMSNVDTYIKEMRLKFITGAAALDDASWSSYLAKLQEYGLDRALEITQTAYERYLAQ